MTDSPKNQVFDLEGHEFIELHNLLKVTGLCHSGAMAKHVIADGRVKVDNEIELRKRCKIKKGQQVQFDGQKITITAES